MRGRRLWTPEMIARAEKLRADGYSYSQIDKVMNLRHGASSLKFHYMKQIAARGSLGNTIEARFSIPEKLLTERDARKAAADLRTPTQQFFGDPPIGFSALDRRGR